jgi:hypothetical protein
MIQTCKCVLTLGLSACLAAGSVQAKKPDHAGGPGGPNETTAILSFSSDQTAYQMGESAQLSWYSEGTRFCQASGDWEGRFDVAGAFWTPPLDGPKTYYLKCTAPGGGVDGTVSVSVLAPEPAPAPEPDPLPDPTPAPAPVVSFEAMDPAVIAGDSTTLQWTASDADGCLAGDGWSGSYGPSGSQLVGPLDADTTFSMTCSGAGGSTSASVMVAVSAPAPEPAPVPTVAFTAADSELAAGASTMLSWTSTDADGCQAVSGWTGTFGPSGSQSVGPIQTSTTYSISCTGAGGSASASTQVTVVPPPTVALSSASAEVNAGGSTTLTWSSKYADTCQASGGWSGVKSVTGSELVGPIDGATTFSLSCSGTGGNAVQMVSVSALGEISISWVAPTENVDGSALTDLDSYRIYVGDQSRSYDNTIEVTDATATSHTFTAASGDYYITMTALDRDGNESAYANEILRSIR